MGRLLCWSVRTRGEIRQTQRREICRGAILRDCYEKRQTYATLTGKRLPDPVHIACLPRAPHKSRRQPQRMNFSSFTTTTKITTTTSDDLIVYPYNEEAIPGDILHRLGLFSIVRVVIRVQVVDRQINTPSSSFVALVLLICVHVRYQKNDLQHLHSH
jgi:hypothetical protein